MRPIPSPTLFVLDPPLLFGGGDPEDVGEGRLEDGTGCAELTTVTTGRVGGTTAVGTEVAGVVREGLGVIMEDESDMVMLKTSMDDEVKTSMDDDSPDWATATAQMADKTRMWKAAMFRACRENAKFGHTFCS